MVWHEAIRKNCELIFRRRAQNLLHHQPDDAFVREYRSSVVDAEREEVSIESEVIERLQMARIVRVHIRVGARYRPDALGPPKGGHYLRLVRLKADPTYYPPPCQPMKTVAKNPPRPSWVLSLPTRTPAYSRRKRP